MGNFKSKVLGGMDWLSGCFYNAAQHQFDSINYYAQNKSFRDTPWIALHSMGLTAMGVGYGATKFGSWCIDKGCTKENCYKAKCFGRNILERGRNLFKGNTDEVNYVEPEVIEEQAISEFFEGNNFPNLYAEDDWNLAVPPQQYDDTAYADIDEDYAERLDCTDAEITEPEELEEDRVLAVEEEEYPPSEEYIESLFEVDEEDEENESEDAPPSTERSEVPTTGGGEAPDPQEDDSSIPFEEDDYIGMPEMEIEIEEDVMPDFDNVITDEDETHFFDDEDIPELDDIPEDEYFTQPEQEPQIDDKEQALADIHSKYPYITNYDPNEAYNYMWDDERKDYDEVSLFLELDKWGKNYGERNPHSVYIKYLEKIKE